MANAYFCSLHAHLVSLQSFIPYFLKSYSVFPQLEQTRLVPDFSARKCPKLYNPVICNHASMHISLPLRKNILGKKKRLMNISKRKRNMHLSHRL